MQVMRLHLDKTLRRQEIVLRKVRSPVLAVLLSGLQRLQRLLDKC